MRKTKKKSALKLARMRMGLFQNELAAKLGIKQGTVSQWERKGALPIKRAKQAAAVLNCNWKDLFD